MKEELTSRDAQWRAELRNAIPARERTAIPRAQMPELDPAYRIHNNEEVQQGLSHEQALVEASRCLDCPDPGCVQGCPVNINIPAFIKNIQRGATADAARVLRLTSALPAVCGRVCPQERQCESRCIYNRMKKPAVAIGWLERFAADHGGDDGENSAGAIKTAPKNGIKIAVAGSGPAGLSFAGAMAALGYDVTVYEALHEIGGVLKYGIPEFRLPNSIVDKEIDSLRRAGVTFLRDVVVGKTMADEEGTMQFRCTCYRVHLVISRGILLGCAHEALGIYSVVIAPASGRRDGYSSLEHGATLRHRHQGVPSTIAPSPYTDAVLVDV